VKKKVIIDGTPYDIEVRLGYLNGYEIGCKNNHLVIITSLSLDTPLKYIVKDLKKELPLIEKHLEDVEKMSSDNISILKELGYDINTMISLGKFLGTLAIECIS
jgi:hypothetical protein